VTGVPARPRLPEPDPGALPADIREFLAGFPPDPMVAMLTHSVSTVRPFIQLAQLLYTALQLPARTRELAILTVAAAVHCDFEFAQHEPISAAAGVSDKIREIIRAGDYASAGLTEPDRAIISLAAAVVSGPQVPDALLAAARAVLSDRELVELLQVVGYYWTFGRVCTVLDVPLTEVYGPGGPVITTPAARPGG
jgi:AhpD family alkylhydroperoxidase